MAAIAAYGRACGDKVDPRVYEKIVEKEGVKMSGTRRQIYGVNEGVYQGVRVGLDAARRKYAAVPKNKVVSIDIERRDQRLFNIPDLLDEEQMQTAVVVLNGSQCVAGRDYKITGNILNWIADRPLYTTDSIAVRYGTAPVAYTAPKKTLEVTVKTPADDAVITLERELLRKLEALEKLTKVKLAEMDMAISDVGTNCDAVAHSVNDLHDTVICLKDEVEKDVAVEEQDTPVEPAEEEEMIQPGVKVWHRLTNEGPWIVVQTTVLDINSRQEGGADNHFKSSYVELAWTVQTEDGVRDFPEVVLTTREPKQQGMSLLKKVAIGVGAIATTAAVVHAPLILKLLGIISQ